MEQLCEIFSKCDQQFHRRFFSSCLCSASSPHSLWPCLLTDPNFMNIFGKSQSKNISGKSVQNLINGFGEVVKISSCLCSASSPHSPEACFLTDQNFACNFLKESHPRKIPVKLFKNLTSDFKEDIFRISSCPYSASSPHLPKPCLLVDQTFAKNF